jgi:hypothetical protein
MAWRGFIKQSTARTLTIGPFLDETDGKTAETSLTISQSDVLLWKEGGTTLAQKNEATSATHRSNGIYTTPIDATDTATLGILTVSVHESGALPIMDDYTVVPANVYDSLVGGTDLLQVDVDQVDGSATAATNQSVAALTMQTGTVDNTGFSPTTTEFESSSITEATADHYIGKRVYFTSGVLQYQGARITDYALASGRGHFTVETLTDAPTNGMSFIVV